MGTPESLISEDLDCLEVQSIELSNTIFMVSLLSLVLI